MLQVSKLAYNVGFKHALVFVYKERYTKYKADIKCKTHIKVML